MTDKIDTSLEAVAALCELISCNLEWDGLDGTDRDAFEQTKEMLPALAAERDRLAERIRELEAENARLRAGVEAVLQKAAGIVNWFDGNDASSEEVADAVMALSSSGGRAALAAQLAEARADGWRRGIEAAAEEVKRTPEWRFINVWQRRDIERNIRALPMPADLGAPSLSVRFDAARPDNQTDWRTATTKTEDGYNG